MISMSATLLADAPAGLRARVIGVRMLAVYGLPLGLQVIGYFDRDAEAFAVAAWLMQARL